MERSKSVLDKGAEDWDQVVHVIDDDALLLDTIGMILDSVDIKHKDYSSAELFLQSHHKEAFKEMAGCLVCDIRMPAISGMQCQKILNDNHSVLPIIFLTGYADVRMAVEAMQNGAFDFVEKPYREQDLLDAVQRALAQNAAILDKKRASEKAQDAMASLTPKESAVLELMLDGMPNKKVASTLNISLRTAEVHRSHIMDKMAVNNVAELVKVVLMAKSEHNHS
ncbi:response regulator [Lacimicrobium sp. SS2-24]|uniref:response regulator transcription factor n=1 Tax=Lacimicrobium sp. SS2-24 TaxID=2005569 RepID=UPI000B4B4794|nr:response regulator [Lacimicrobium sp. SS2-24]